MSGLIAADLHFSFYMALFGLLCSFPLTIATYRILRKTPFAQMRVQKHALQERSIDTSLAYAVLMFPFVSGVLTLVTQIGLLATPALSKVDFLMTSYALLPIVLGFIASWKIERYIIWPLLIPSENVPIIRKISNLRAGVLLTCYLIGPVAYLLLLNAIYKARCGCGG